MECLLLSCNFNICTFNEFVNIDKTIASFTALFFKFFTLDHQLKKIYQKKILEMTADAVVITGGRCCDTQEFVLVVYFANCPVDGSDTVSSNGR